HPAPPSFPTRRSSDLQTVFSVVETECLSADSVSEFLNHISLFVGVSVGYCHCHCVLAVLRGKSLCLLGGEHERLVIVNFCKFARSEEHTSELQSRFDL